MARFVLSSPSNSALLPSLRVAPCELLPPFQALRRGPCVCSRRTAYFCSPCVCRLSPQNGGNRVWETKLQKATTRLKDATAHVSECQIAIGAAALLPGSRRRCENPSASFLEVASICHKVCRDGRLGMLTLATREYDGNVEREARIMSLWTSGFVWRDCMDEEIAQH